MLEIKLYKSKWKAIRLILLSLPFVIASLFFIIKKDDHGTMNWVCLCFFGLGIPLGIFNLLDRRPEIILDKNGIFDRTSYGIFDKRANRGFVKWSSIKDAYAKIYQGSYRGLPQTKQKYICLVLDENAKADLNRNGKIGGFSKFLGLADYTIPLINLKKIDEQKFVEFIKAMSVADGVTQQQLLLTTQL